MTASSWYLIMTHGILSHILSYMGKHKVCQWNKTGSGYWGYQHASRLTL